MPFKLLICRKFERQPVSEHCQAESKHISDGHFVVYRVYRSWKWVCYLLVICPADSAPSMFPPSYPSDLIPLLET